MGTAVTIPVVGTSVTVGPLHVADAGSGTTTYNGQHVAAGSTATVAIPEDVRVFTIAQHPGESSWASGQIPTLNPALGVIGPDVIDALEKANGATVTLTFNGTDWFASTVTAVVATPSGATLPADNSDGDLFILDGVGLHYWNGSGFQPVDTDSEVGGPGPTLPADGSEYELYRLEGSPTSPSALYRWSESVSEWIEA